MKLKTLSCFCLLVLVAANASAQHIPSTAASGSPSLVDWPQFHFDPGLSGFNPFETVLGPSNVASVNLKWSYAPSEGWGVTGAPVLADGVMYFGLAFTGVSNGPNDRVPGSGWALYALDANSGAFLWKYETEPIFGSPAVANGMVYVIDADFLYALDASTGAPIWQFDVPGQAQYCSPTVVNNVLYFTDPGKAVYALNATTGALVWKYATLAANSAPAAVANGLVYVNGGNGIVSALNANTGVLVWTKQLGTSLGPPRSLGGGTAGQAVANGILYVSIPRKPNTYDMYALDATTGAILWRAGLSGLAIGETPAVGNGMAYINSDALYALNASTGAIVWKVSGGQSSPVLANGVVYTSYLSLSTQGAVFGVLVAFDASTGALLWQYKTGIGSFNSALFPAPIVVNGMIYGSLIGGPDQVGAFALSNQ